MSVHSKEDIVLRGEQKLHALASLLAEGLLRTENVVGCTGCAGPKEEVETASRIVIEEGISPSQLAQTTDYRLAAELRAVISIVRREDEFSDLSASVIPRVPPARTWRRKRRHESPCKGE